MPLAGISFWALQSLLRIRASNQNGATILNEQLDVDLLVITALSEEKKALKHCFCISFDSVSKSGINYNIGTLKHADRHITIATVQPNEMGPIPAAVLTTKAIIEAQPKAVAMTGICAGIKSLTKLGDLIVANQVFDHTAGTYKNGSLTPFQQAINQDQWILQFIRALLDKEPLLDEVFASHPLPTEIREKPVVHVGPIASGSIVVKDEDYVDNLLERTSKLYGVDMEAYGVAHAAAICSNAFRNVPWIVIKGVVDHADNNKGDDWHSYCSFVSAKFLMRMLGAVLDGDKAYRWLESARETQKTQR